MTSITSEPWVQKCLLTFWTLLHYVIKNDLLQTVVLNIIALIEDLEISQYRKKKMCYQGFIFLFQKRLITFKLTPNIKCISTAHFNDSGLSGAIVHIYRIADINCCPRKPWIVEICCGYVPKLISFEENCWFYVSCFPNDFMCLCICRLIHLFFLMLKSIENSSILGRISITSSFRWSQGL